MKKSAFLAVALAGAAALLLAGCAGGGGGTPSDTGSAEAPRACVILPDAASSPRWEGQDHPYLEQGLTDAGYEVDIQNAQGDTAKYVTIAEQQMTQGCDIMILADFEGAAVGVTETAQAEGIPVIAYDRPIENADYYVSFDNFGVGELQGQCVLDGLEAAGKDPATAIVIYMGGDATDGNAKQFHDGAVSVMEAAGITPAQEPPGIWDQEASATNFENALTATGGKVDAVWAANDPNAAGVISILDANNLVVPVSGQDATVAGLQNVLLGKQTCTIWKAANIEGDAAIELATQLLNGETPTIDNELDGVPYIALTPVLITPENVKDVVAAGDQKASDICTGDVAAKCAEFGVE